MNSPAILVVIAHPDDETLFAGFLHALKRRLNATIDLVCITNGEGGFRHSGAASYLYDNLELSKEEIGRQHLPRIRKQEMLGSARIIGIRKVFFYDQLDLKKDHDVDEVYRLQWDKEWIIKYLMRTISTANGVQGYDFLLIMLPNVVSHAHHTASGLLVLEAIERLRLNMFENIKIPTVIGGAEFPTTTTTTEIRCYPSNHFASVSMKFSDPFEFKRSWKLTDSKTTPDYHMIVMWACCEHKSQGSLISETLTTFYRETENYYYMNINEDEKCSLRWEETKKLFDYLGQIHHDQTGKMCD